MRSAACLNARRTVDIEKRPSAPRTGLAVDLRVRRQAPRPAVDAVDRRADPVTPGATTIWERWDGQRPDGSFQSPGMNSFNHYAYGTVGNWMYQTVAGLDTDPERPGYRHLTDSAPSGRRVERGPRDGDACRFKNRLII